MYSVLSHQFYSAWATYRTLSSFHMRFIAKHVRSTSMLRSRLCRS